MEKYGANDALKAESLIELLNLFKENSIKLLGVDLPIFTKGKEGEYQKTLSDFESTGKRIIWSYTFDEEDRKNQDYLGECPDFGGALDQFTNNSNVEKHMKCIFSFKMGTSPYQTKLTEQGLNFIEKDFNGEVSFTYSSVRTFMREVEDSEPVYMAFFPLMLAVEQKNIRVKLGHKWDGKVLISSKLMMGDSVREQGLSLDGSMTQEKIIWHKKGAFREYGLDDILGEGKRETLKDLKNKVVILGKESTSEREMFKTPVSDKMSVSEINANIVAMYLNKSMYKTTDESFWANVYWIVGLIFLSSLLFYFLGNKFILIGVIHFTLAIIYCAADFYYYTPNLYLLFNVMTLFLFMLSFSIHYLLKENNK